MNEEESILTLYCQTPMPDVSENIILPIIKCALAIY